MQRKVLLISNHNTDRRPWNGVCYEVLRTVSAIEPATLIAPSALAGTVRLNSSLFEPLHRDRGSVLSILREINLMRNGAAFEPVTVEEDHDVCFFIGQFLSDLINLRRVRGWRKRSRIAVAFILETWEGSLERCKAELALLNEFDHVFVLNADSIASLSGMIRTPVSFLATATDCLAAAPRSEAAPRAVDAVCFGRRLDPVHRRLRAIAQDRNWLYLFDTWSGLKAIDWEQVRESNASVMRRSRYAVVWDPSVSAKKAPRMQDQRALTTRYFEAAAGGAIILGSRTPSDEFAAHFDWPDAVVDIATDGSDLEARLNELEADPVRCATIRRNNVVNCLRRHDWLHRWERVLETLQLEPTPAHLERRAALEDRAQAIELDGAEPAPALRAISA